jgi:hypothetical protein
MRFILNFIFFGVLFYAIYLIFPDAFHTMVGWANSIYEFIRDIFLQLTSKVQEWRGQKGPHNPSPQRALFLIPLWIMAVNGKIFG